MAVNSGGDYSWRGKGFISQAVRVNSKETVVGDLKERNPWNGNMVALGDDHYRSLVSGRTDEIESGFNETPDLSGEMGPSFNVGKLVSTIERESQEGKKLDFVNEFENGTIYKINGTYYNFHEGLNYLWGSSLDKLGIPSFVAVEAAKFYNKSAYDRDVKAGVKNKYQRVGPNNEQNHNKAIEAGYRLF